MATHSVTAACRRVIWFGNGGSGHSYAVPYPSIGMHAVSSDAEAFQRPCIYMQIDLDGPAPGGDDDEEDLAPELRLVPADAAAREQPLFFGIYCLIAVVPLTRRGGH